MKKIIALLIALAPVAAFCSASLGDREAALEYLKTHKPGKTVKPILHSLSYYAKWCSEGDKKYWPQAVKYCKPSKTAASNALCSYVNTVEDARVKGKANCDPS